MSKKIIALIGLVILVAGVAWWTLNHNHKTSQTNSSSTSQKSQQAAPSFDKHKYSIDDPASIWVVVNKPRPLNPITYAPTDLVAVGNGQFMRAEAAQALTHLFSDAKTKGYNLVAESGYRSYATQTTVYNSEVKGFGQAKADTESARPGHSEHQTGWGVDIGSPGCFENCFGKTKASKWLLDNAYKYGFLLRYPESKTDVTGYRNEPWHFRYIGMDLSEEMHRTNTLTLEEFFNVVPASQPY